MGAGGGRVIYLFCAEFILAWFFIVELVWILTRERERRVDCEWKRRTRCCTLRFCVPQNRQIHLSFFYVYNCRMLVTNTAFFSWRFQYCLLIKYQYQYHVRSRVFILADVLIQVKGREGKTNCSAMRLTQKCTGTESKFTFSRCEATRGRAHSRSSCRHIHFRIR